jgi:hypothetical protein
MSDEAQRQEVNLEQSGFDGGVSLRVELETLKTQLRTMVELQGALLKKLEQQHTMLGTIAKFVKDNGVDTPCFGVGL